MAILDIHDLGLAREQGRDVVGVMAFVQRPLAAVLAQPGDPLAEGPRGQARRRHRPAVRRGGAALGRRGRRRRPRQGAHDHDRLPGRQGDAGRAGRRRDGVLERRGRRAEARAAGDPRVPRRRLRRAELPGARARRDARDARGRRAGGPGDDPGAAARLRRGAARSRRAPSRRCSPSSRGWTRTRSRPSSTRSTRRSPRARRASGSCAPTCSRAWARWDVEFGILSEPVDIRRAFDFTATGPPPAP